MARSCIWILFLDAAQWAATGQTELQGCQKLVVGPRRYRVMGAIALVWPGGGELLGAPGRSDTGIQITSAQPSTKAASIGALFAGRRRIAVTFIRNVYEVTQ